jgi:hypothetical protein
VFTPVFSIVGWQLFVLLHASSADISIRPTGENAKNPISVKELVEIRVATQLSFEVE